MDQILIQTVNGLVNGMILALVASGLTLIFGIMDVVNFAHGDLVMLGGFVGAVTIAQTGSFWLALLVAALTIGVFGAVLQATTLRPLLGRDPLTTILATFGLSLVLQKYAIWQWGPSARQIPAPLTGRFQLFYLEYPGTASWRRRCPRRSSSGSGSSSSTASSASGSGPPPRTG